MGSSSYYRTLSPGSGRHHVAGPRASTGMVQLDSSYDPYETHRGRHDHDDYYPSDVGYTTSHRHHASHRPRIEAQPVSSQKFREPGQSTKKRTEYTIQPQARHRSHTASASDLYETPARLSVPAPSHLRPVVTSGRGRSPSPLPSKSGHYLVPASSHHGGRHRRVYSTDYASDTGRLDPRESVKHRSPQNGAYRIHPPSGRPRYPAYDGLKRGDDIDDYDAYSYTTPREQFDRDYPVKPRYPTGRSSVDRPVSMNVMEDHPQWLAPKEPRHHGPPPTSWGLDKLGREGRPRASSRGVEDHHRDTSRSRGHDRALVAMPHESDDEYDSHSDSHRRRRHRRSRYESDRDGRHRDDRDDRSPRPHNGSGEKVLAGLGTAALGAGYSDMSDYDNRSARRHNRRPRDLDRDYDSAQPPSRDLHDGIPPNAERNKQLYLEPGGHHRRRSRRHPERRRDSDSDVYTDDEDLRNYRHEPSATPRRSRHSSTDASSAEDTSSRRHPRDRSHHRSSRSQRMLEDGHSNDSRRFPSPDSKDDLRKLITVDPPTAKEPEAAPKGILKPPRQSFPEEPNPVREGVAPLKDAHKKGIPPGARWTKIDRRLVNPAALEAGNERFEERSEYVIVLRVLTKEEIQAYAVKTQEIRDERPMEYVHDKHRRMDENQRHGRQGEELSSDDEDEDHEPLQLEAPPAHETDRHSLPVRPRESNNSTPESERVKMSPPAAQAHR